MRGDGGDESLMVFYVLLKILGFILGIWGAEVTLSGVCLKSYQQREGQIWQGSEARTFNR